MKLQKKKKKVNLVVIFLVVALVFAVIWGACELIRHLSSYGNGATINTQPEEEEPVPEETPEDTAPAENLIDGIPANPHDPNDFAEKNGFIVYTGTETWHTGVDVSAHQGEIDWEKAAADGIQFAMIRLGYRGYTEGEIGLDPYFLRNIEGAQAAGLDVGVYFFSQAITKDEAVEEAKFVLNWIEGYELDYPIFFDWEDIEADARTDGYADADRLCGRLLCSHRGRGLPRGRLLQPALRLSGAESPEPAEIHVLAGRIQSCADVHL